MYEAIPMCLICGVREVVGQFSFANGEGFCSAHCEDAANADADRDECDYDEPCGSHDLSDDADALASAGYGNDEDYNGYDYGDYYGGEDY